MFYLVLEKQLLGVESMALPMSLDQGRGGMTVAVVIAESCHNLCS
jgi:hypothetical protein